MHHYQDLIKLFNTCFAKTHNTRLVKGGEEPLYMPANENCAYHSIIFAHGFFSSALHECAHWFIAGEERRKLIDYGYWYVPDGRSKEQQALFQVVEVKPQALEWLLSKAAKFPFQFSVDNLDGEEWDTESFKTAVKEQVSIYEQEGLPPRAQIFHAALREFYK
ncbi:transporting ATPase (plasmid) [Legionella adelaidensis]|uniref:Transporting ATPase n=1 Tax=Legionella adelaidensis TaxID=45056 RepID=A0A0W0R5J2_9GAMM|nr:elongation factor P hydroxylase [Legionella adelaidensis]KTC66315.1 transporting ATPase [Legionella adelaidensis]VEH84911.1 transporting ATPase [Legionella adelaidensis]